MTETGGAHSDGVVFSMNAATGINENILEPTVNIYPNPATNLLTIRSSSFHNEAVTVSVVNMLGETVQEEKINYSNETNINIKNVCVGIYFLQLKSESGMAVQKFIKE